MIRSNLPNHFEPSSEKLLSMIAQAEAKFASDREQAALRKEAQAERRMQKMMEAEAAQRRLRFWAP